MNKGIYTNEQWESDNSFKAVPGQEITEQIYDDMLNCVPPKSLPRSTAAKVMQEHEIYINAGFLMGEPHSTGKEGLLYLAFGMNGHGNEKHFYYLGLSPAMRRDS